MSLKETIRDQRISAAERAVDLDLLRIVTKIAKSGKAHGTNAYIRDFDKRRFHCTVRGDGSIRASVVMPVDKIVTVAPSGVKQIELHQTTLYSSHNSGEVVDVLREGPWIARAKALAAMLPDASDVDDEGTDEEQRREKENFEPFND